jgi:serine/threonine protein kinase/tetratricopeptide (TPR) repeat protein
VADAPQPDSPAPTVDAAALEPTLTSGERPRPQPLIPRGTAVGRYLVLELLGEGGMGTVYSAYDPELDRRVAIKLLKLGGATPEAARARLQREAQAMARLSHENVLAVHDVGVFGQALFMAMELVEGTTLRDWLAERARSPREILQVLLAAGEGLSAAHAAGLVHRDFKPENVLVDRQGRVRVTDFGLARVEERAPEEGSPEEPAGARPQAVCGPSGSVPTLAGAIVGTPAYMSPEQLDAGPTDARTDQFSFCVALWEALCGERPFNGLDVPTLHHAVLVAPPPAPPRSLPFHVRRALARGLARRPEDRFPSMAALLLALRRDPAARAGRAALAALAATALVGAAAAFAWQWHQDRTFCEQDAARARDERWPPRQRERLRAALDRSGVPPLDRDAALAEVEGGLERWRQARRQTCEEARGGAGAPAGANAGAAGCLELFALRFDSTVQLLCDPGVDARQYLGAALETLGRPDKCLAATQKRPAVAEERRRDWAAATQRADVLNALGRAAQVVAEAPRAAAQAREAGALDLASSLQQSLGWALWNSAGPGEAAEQAMRQAVLDADASGDDRRGLQSRIALLNLYIIGRGDPGPAAPVAREVDAWLRRLGPPEDLEQHALPGLAALQSALDHGPESLRLYRRAVALSIRIHGEGSSQAAGARNDLATELDRQGRRREALAEFRATADILDRARFAEPTARALAWGNLTISHLDLGEWAPAEAALQRTEAIIAPVRHGVGSFAAWVDLLRATLQVEQGQHAVADATFAASLARRDQLDGLTLIMALTGHAKALLGLGRPAEAIPAAEEAIAAAQRVSDVPSRAAARFALARALWAAGSERERERALRLAEAALADYQGPDDTYNRSQVEAWLRRARP